ncbi:ergothioneine biosynthesis protein EgtC [soil metagenome]
MCRHLAYLGVPQSLRALLVDPPHGLYRQAWAPRRQSHGVVNADGFGVGWYAHVDPAPARYRRAVPMWADPSFADLARVTHTHALLAAVRSATPGTGPEEAAAAPYAAGRWLFSHNGAVEGWPEKLEPLAARLPAAALLALEARCDSALVWALVVDALDSGSPPEIALADTVRTVAAAADARLNLLVTDGTTIVATTYGDSLCWRADDHGVVVASEPADDGAGWQDVPDRRLLVATAADVVVTPLETP